MSISQDGKKYFPSGNLVLDVITIFQGSVVKGNLCVVLLCIEG